MTRVPFANVGAEAGVRGALPKGAVDVVTRLTDAWKSVVDDPPDAWPWLARADGLVPWLSTAPAQSEARRIGIAYCAAPPDVVRVVHDKAFTIRTARDKRIDDVADLCIVLEPAEVTSARIAVIVGEWPPWAWRSFTVKPRWGTSGRGRVRGADGHVWIGSNAPALDLGAVVEPWLERTMDLSSLWHVDEHGEPHLVGVTLPKMREAGVYLGCDVVITEVGPMAGTHWDEPAVEKARVLVEAAAAVGYRGPCGVDAFVWRDEGGALQLRGAVELNARFTAGHVALGLIARREPKPGARFRFRLDRKETLLEVDNP